MREIQDAERCIAELNGMVNLISHLSSRPLLTPGYDDRTCTDDNFESTSPRPRNRTTRLQESTWAKSEKTTSPIEAEDEVVTIAGRLEDDETIDAMIATVVEIATAEETDEIMDGIREILTAGDEIRTVGTLVEITDETRVEITEAAEEDRGMIIDDEVVRLRGEETTLLDEKDDLALPSRMKTLLPGNPRASYCLSFLHFR